MTLSIIEKAMRLAARAHQSQTRKDSDLPYISHPAMVALMLQKHLFPPHVIAAGLVHDVLEDTAVSEDELRAELGDDVVDIVVALSEDKALSWEARKERYIESVRRASDEVKAVSICDKIHNLESLLEGYRQLGNEIWNRFNRPKDKQQWLQEALLSMYQESWSHPLVDEYGRLVERFNALEDSSKDGS